MIKLNISEYHKPYDFLNGLETQKVRPLDLARAIVTVGQSSWGKVYQLGIFRIGELICKALAFTKIEKGNLVLSESFLSLNQSEKAPTSYYFGQGLTKLYAEHFLKIKWLLHLDSYREFVTSYEKGIAKSKIIVGKSTKVAQRPDLIGIVNNKDSHILEAKGNSSGYDRNIMQHAINQVSQVKLYNNKKPKTRTACYFNLSTSPIEGTIIDPENDNNGINLKLNAEGALNQYYSFFKVHKDKFTIPLTIGGHTYKLIQVGMPNLLFGFDERILTKESSQLLAEGLYDSSTLLFNEENDENINFSLGLDGLILIELNHLLPPFVNELFTEFYQISAANASKIV